MQVVYITASSLSEAESLAITLVEENLVACVNLFENVRSFYRWKGNLETSNEVVIIAKTTSDRLSSAIAKVEEIHSYSCPCVFALDTSKVSIPFFNWITGM